MTQIRAITRPAAVIVFFALALVPVALFGVNGPWPGRGEPLLAPPAAFPPNLTSNTFRRISAWFDDRVGLRYPLLKLGSEMSVAVWRPRTMRNTIIGRDPWLFSSDDESRHVALMADLRGRLRFDDEAVARFDTQLRAARSSFTACGKTALVVVAPNKQSIYPEHIRDRARTYRKTRLDDLLERLSPVARSMIVDPRPILRAVKANDPPLFLKTDSHWNGLGAFLAYRTVVQALARANAIDRPELATLDNYEIDSEPFQGGDMAVSVLHLPWRFADEKVTLRARKALPPVTMTDEGQRTLYLNPEGKGRLLIFGDSFAPPLAALLARHFKEVDLRLKQIWQVPLDSNADVVLVQIVERHLHELSRMPPALARGCPGAS
jgi:alginate O-acetyltransferase complex protein AlgJ